MMTGGLCVTEDSTSWTETLCVGSLVTGQSSGSLDMDWEWGKYTSLTSGQYLTTPLLTIYHINELLYSCDYCSCAGRETRIDSCLKSTKTQNCSHAQDVGLECNVPDSSCLENSLNHVR